MTFWRRNLAFFRLAVLSQLEYRLNYFTDAILQPSVTSLIEVTLWIAVFKGNAQGLVNGYPFSAYVGYAIWAAFLGRITSTWTYEFRMIEEIDSGSVNSVLVRPMSFFEYYMSQFMGYKVVTLLISICVPLLVTWVFKLAIHWDRILPALVLVIYYLLLVQTLSFIVATTAFHLNRVHSLTVAKNLGLWLLTGELVPLDLFPESVYRAMMQLPFANAVYVPVGFITGRLQWEALLHGFITTTYGLALLAPMAMLAWRAGIRRYAGTGA